MRLLIIIIFFFACSTESVKLDSTGHSSEIVIVSNTSTANNKQIEKLEKLFSSEIYGLTRFEPQFKLLNVKESNFKSIIRRHKNIIIFSDKYPTKKINNVWSKNQIVWYLNSNDINFNQKIHEIFDDFYLQELKSYRAINQSNRNTKLSELLSVKYGKRFVVTNNFIKAYDSDKVTIVTDNKSNNELIQHLVFFKPEKPVLSKNQLYMLTDSLSERLLKGSKLGSYVKIENMYEPILYKGFYRGLWKLNKGFMGGPIIISSYNDLKIITFGIVFAPNTDKRSYIKKMEAILSFE
ncbi:MAG: DUF4837 family protein [Flavobacteriales bacterium TMED84]|nr:MAG: DUF4837 family protein [Flavobacteriales bacterium TMED84]